MSETEESTELPQESLDYFGDELAARTFIEKYALREGGELQETHPRQMWERVARAMASVEEGEKQGEWQEKFYDLLEDFTFVPGGRIMHGAGVPHSATLTNCYVRSIEEDSIEGIFDWCKNVARTYSYGGGMGTDIGVLRPRGAPVDNTARTSSGATSFMELFSTVTGTIGQRGRRGALLLSCPVDHPDIEQFVKAKANDVDSVRFANISVKATDDFMEAVENGGGSFTTSFESDEVDRIEKEINPQELWDDIIAGAHQDAEPGVLFWDHIKRESPSEYNSPVVGTNPSLVAGTKVLTSDGIFGIDELEGQKLNVPVPSGDESLAECIKTGDNEEIYEIEFTGGHTYRCTAEHKWPVWWTGNDKFRKITTECLETGDRIKVSKRKSLKYGHVGDKDDGFLAGTIIGDGSITERKNGLRQVSITFGHEDEEIKDRVLEILESITSQRYEPTERQREGKPWYEIHVNNDSLREKLDEWGIEGKESLPSIVWSDASEDFRRGLINGLISTDGYVPNPESANNGMLFTTKSESLATEFSELLGFYGAKNTIKESTLTDASFPNGKDYDKEYTRFDVKICRSSIIHLSKFIELTHAKKDERLENIPELERESISSKTMRVKNVEKTDNRKPVWDLRVLHQDHQFILPHVTTGNCGEQPLPSGGECVLGHVNLSSIVQKEFTDNAKLDWDKLKELTCRGVRFLDSVVEYNLDKHPHEDQAEQARKTRRIGLGVTGLGDMLAKLKVAYDSEEALDIVDGVMKFIRNHAYRTSINLAEEKEPFPEFDAEQHLDQPFIQRLPEDIREGIQEHGLRNVCLLTVAPVGSGSVLTQTSSGVEPIFDIGYQRRSESLSEENYEVDHQLVAEYLDQEGGDVEELPDFFVTAHDIDPFFRVDMQATLQQYVDSAISSTINLPEDIDVETVKDLYMRAWKKGCKGVTVYRENSREGILITDEASEEEEVPEERPKSLEGETFKFKIKDEEGKPRNSYVTVNEHDGKPYETFVSPTREGSDALARMTSLALRYNVPMGEVLDQLKKGATNMYSPGQVIAKALQSMGREGGVECPECGEMGLQHENGCKTCYECGHSACG